MAVLKLDIIVNDADAEAKLDKIESKVKSVTAASDTQGAALSKVADSFQRVSDKAETTSKVTTTYAESLSKASSEAIKTSSAVETLGAAKIAQTAAVSQASDAWVKEQMAIWDQVKAQNEANAAAKIAIDTQGGLAGALGMTAEGLIAVGGYLTAAAAAGAFWARFLFDSADAYLEHTGRIDELNAAIDSIAETWQNAKIAVGAVLLGNVEDLQSWASLGITAINLFAQAVLDKLSAAIAMFNIMRDNAIKVWHSLPFTWALTPENTAPAAPNIGQGGSASVGPLNTRGFFRENEIPSAFTFGSPTSGTTTRGIGGGSSAAAATARADAEALRASVQSLRADIQAVNYYVQNIPTFQKLAELPALPTAVAGVPSGLPNFVQGLPGGIPAAPKTSPSFFQSAFGSQANLGSMLGLAISGAIQGGQSIWASAGSMLGEHLGRGVTSKFGGFLSQHLGSFLGSSLSSLIPGLGTLLGPLLGALGSKIGGFFKNLFGGNQVKDLINQTFGSYDALRQQLNELGAAGEQMWIKLTQQTGKGDVNSARQQIEAINAALEAHKQKLNETQTAAQQAGAAESAAFQQAKEQIAALDQQIQGLQQSIANEAPEEVMGIVEAQTRQQIQILQEQRTAAQQQMEQAGQQFLDTVNGADVTVNVHWNPDPLPTPGGGSAPYEPYEAPEPPAPPMARGGIVRARPGGTLVRVGEAGRDEAIVPLGAGGAGGGTAVIQLDGRTIAEIAVPYIPGVVKRYRVGTL